MTSLWIGRLLSRLVILALLADASLQFLAPGMIEAEMEASGFPPGLAHPLGAIMLASAAVYAIPRTAILGAILITGFLGGAIATHFRLGEIASPPQLISLLLGAMAWGGLYLRDLRVRALLPMRQPA